MATYLQESGGLRRVPAVQSPVPVDARGRLSLGQKLTLMAFVLLLAMSYLVPLLSSPATAETTDPQPASHGL